MALGQNIDSTNALIDGIITARGQIRTDRAAIRALEEAMIPEVQDAYDNGLGSIPAGFLPDANGTYTLKRGSRAIEVDWDFDNLTVTGVRVLRPNEFKETVIDIT